MEKITRATAIYTGGGIYLYLGQVDSGDYFFTADDYPGYVLFLNEDPENTIDECCNETWQYSHKVGEYTGRDADSFKKSILTWILENLPQGNYTAEELERRLTWLV